MELKKAEVAGNEKEKEGEVGRILQELKNPEVGKGNEKGLETRSDERDLERINRFKRFWNSMSMPMKRDGFLKIRVHDLKGHFGSKDEKALEVLNEALWFVEEKKTWRFWECCECGEKLVDGKSLEGHVYEHFWKLNPGLRKVLPATVEKEEMEKILDCSWKPVDVPYAVKLVGDCCKESDSSPDHVVFPEVFWPVCEDRERGMLLDDIHCLFKALIKVKCLSTFHIELTQQFALEEFKNLASGSHLMKHKVHQTLGGICFLGASELEKILEFLETISDSCKLDPYSDRSGIVDDGSISNQWDEVEEKIELSENASWLYVDENLLALDCAPDAASAADTSFLWIFFGPSSGDPLQSWNHKKDEKVQQGMEIFKAFNKLFHCIENLCKEKLGRIDALKAVEGRFSAGIKEKQIDETKDKTEFERMRSILRRADPSIANQLSIDIAKLDAQILQNRDEWHKLECKFEHVSANDYRLILLPLVKSYLRAHLEDLAKKKSDAAADALITEVELDSKRGVGGGSDNLRSSKEKARDKKKTIQNKRDEPDEPNEIHLLGNVPREQVSPCVTADDEEEEELQQEDQHEVWKTLLEEARKSRSRIDDEDKVKQVQNFNLDSSDVYGAGLRNDAGENNCFLNIIIKSLWHLRQFRDKFSKRIEHVYVRDSCVVCGLLDAFIELRTAPTPLRKALGKSTTTRNFQMAHLEDLAKEKSDAATDALLAEVELDSKRGVQGRNDNLRSSKEKAKDKKKTKHDNRDEESKVSDSFLDSDELQVLGNMPREQVSPRIMAEGKEEEELQQENLHSIHEGLLEHQEEALRLKAWKTLLEEAQKALVKESTLVGIGLRNNADENNCFLNVIIQSLWHLRRFRDEFSKGIEHVHAGDSCVVCGLLDVFTELRTAYTNLSREAVAPTPLRIALSKSSTTQNFQMRQWNDPAEAFLEILTELHDRAPIDPGLRISDSGSVKDMGPWRCTNVRCIAHSLFGINKLRDVGPLNVTFNYHIAASALRAEPGIQNAFEKILHTDVITNPPHIFTTVLGWEGEAASAGEIEATLEVLSAEIDLSHIDRGTGSQHKHKLVSVVNYHPPNHYSCFIYSHEHDLWVRYDDEIVRVIGSWTDVLSKYKNRCIQPYILFFEDVN